MYMYNVIKMEVIVVEIKIASAIANRQTAKLTSLYSTQAIHVNLSNVFSPVNMKNTSHLMHMSYGGRKRRTCKGQW